MFLEQAVNPINKIWKYIVGTVIIVIGASIGQVPLVAALYMQSVMDDRPMPTTNEGIMKFMDSNLTLLLLMISFAGALLAVYFVVRFVHNQTFKSVTTSRAKVDWNRIIFAFGVWSLMTIISTVIAYFIVPEDFVWNFKPLRFAILALIAIPLIPIQTSAEEYIFRGYLMQGFANLALNKWLPLLMTSVIFGLMHIANPEVEKMGYIVMVFYIGTGLFLGIITLMDEGMELALGFHAANNMIGALLVTADWSAFQTASLLKDISEPTAGYDILLPIIIIYPILLYIFSKKYKWTNWREKLTGKIYADGNDISEGKNGQPHIQ